MTTLPGDLRYAFRSLSKTPVLTAVALASLAVGIGANTAIFTLMDEVLLRSLPVREPERLVLLASPGGLSGSVNTAYNDEVVLSWPKYRALSERTGDVFEGLLARFPFGASVAALGQVERTAGELVSGNYFDLLGVRPELGRLITEQDTRRRGGNRVAVLSFAAWTSRFGGSPDVLNQAVIVNGQPLTIVGVAGRRFRSIGAGESPQVFVPITLAADMLVISPEGFEEAHNYWLNVFGRLRPAVTRENAEARVAPVWRAIVRDDALSLSPRSSEKYRRMYVSRPLQLRPAGNGISSVRDDARPALMLLMGIVGLVLLIACANVASLLLGRAAERAKEMAIRLSLGATRRRLITQVLAESVILAVLGCALGVLLAAWSKGLLMALISGQMSTDGMTLEPDGRVLLFAVAVTAATALLFGCVPALRASRPDLRSALNEQAFMPASGGHARFRQGLVIGQIALSVLLLAAAGVFAHSLYNLRTANPGFRSEELVSFRLDPGLNGYTPERTLRLFRDIEEALRVTPGVTAVASAKWSLLTNTIDMTGYDPEGWIDTERRGVTLHQNLVSAGFFRVMGVPLIAGREFRDSDRAGSPPVAIINETTARKYFAGRNPVGLHLTRFRGKAVPMEIVAVVKDSKYDDLREQAKEFVFRPAAQDADPGNMTFYARSRLSAEALAPAVRDIVRHEDPNLPVGEIKTVRAQIMESLFLDRMVAALAGAFALLATGLAAIGLYGVIAWAVMRRKREIGIRIALGASPKDVLGMVFREVAAMSAIGMAIAAGVWLAASRVLASLLFAVNTNDPGTLAAAVLVLAVVAGAAGFVPARRAARIDPGTVIREQ